MSLTCHVEIGRVGRVGRGCHEDATRKLFPWNSSFTIQWLADRYNSMVISSGEFRSVGQSLGADDDARQRVARSRPISCCRRMAARRSGPRGVRRPLR